MAGQEIPAAIRIAAYTGDAVTITGEQASELLAFIGRLTAARDTAVDAGRRPLHEERVW